MQIILRVQKLLHKKTLPIQIIEHHYEIYQLRIMIVYRRLVMENELRNGTNCTLRW